MNITLHKSHTTLHSIQQYVRFPQIPASTVTPNMLISANLTGERWYLQNINLHFSYYRWVGHLLLLRWHLNFLFGKRFILLAHFFYWVINTFLTDLEVLYILENVAPFLNMSCKFLFLVYHLSVASPLVFFATQKFFYFYTVHFQSFIGSSFYITLRKDSTILTDGSQENLISLGLSQFSHMNREVPIMPESKYTGGGE